MTNPTPLSPAAQAVWEAAWSDTTIQCGDIEGTRRAQVAAALRAAANQVVPVPIDAGTPEEHWALLGVKNRLLAIADELEGR